MNQFFVFVLSAWLSYNRILQIIETFNQHTCLLMECRKLLQFTLVVQLPCAKSDRVRCVISKSSNFYDSILHPSSLSRNVGHVLSFQSRTETNCDYVVFYKDANHLQRWGEDRYSGRDGAENWPGCGNRPPLQVRMPLIIGEWEILRCAMGAMQETQNAPDLWWRNSTDLGISNRRCCWVKAQEVAVTSCDLG